MIKWFKKLFKQTEKQMDQLVQKVSLEAHNVADYVEHNLYWEKIVHQDHHGNPANGVGVVRFYDKLTGKLKSYSTFMGKTEQEIHKLMDDHIANHMKG